MKTVKLTPDEQRANKETRRLIRKLITAAKPIWHWGDGQGGGVVLDLMKEANRRGLSVPKQWRSFLHT
jgi:hypothetical protein